MRSLRGTLLWLLLGGVGLLMALAAGLSYRAGLQEAGEMFDARLVQSSRVLLSLVDEPLSDLSGHPGEPVVLKGWHGQAEGVGDALAFRDGHAYENKLAFQVWTPDGRLLLRSDSAPDTPLAALAPGFADVVIDQAQWRAFTLVSPEGRWFQSAERSDIRGELARDIAMGTLLPLLLALPLMAVVIWFAVSRATRPLQRLSDEIGHRDPERMTPLETADVPGEVHGLVVAVNGLLQRLDAALARERRFVADAAHELRTPISALKVHAGNARPATSDPERAESQAHLDRSIERVERLVQQLLSLSRAEATLRADARLSLDGLVRTEVEALQPLVEQRAQRLDLSALAPVDVTGDELALGLLVRNLVENALRYTPVDGRIAVRTWHEDGMAMLRVEDDGPGIAESEHERVFDRFYRVLGSASGGSGLGLAIVREVAASHGAQVRLSRATVLGGLAVDVVLPAADPHAVRAPAAT